MPYLDHHGKINWVLPLFDPQYFRLYICWTLLFNKLLPVMNLCPCLTTVTSWWFVPLFDPLGGSDELVPLFDPLGGTELEKVV